MRSRVTAKDWPTSSRGCSLPSSRPKRILMTFSSRGVSVFRTDEVCSFKFRLMTASEGETTALSSMKSPRCESSSSPMGVWREFGSCANFHALADFLGARFAAQLLHQLPAGADQLVDRLDHVHRDADGAGLVGDGASNGRATPPGRVCRKLVAAAPLEFVHGVHQADVAFLNQVQELQPAIGIFFRDGNNEAQVGFNQLFLGLLGFGFSPKYHLEHALQVGEPRFTGNFNLAKFRAARAQFLTRLERVVTLGGVSAAL